MNGKSDKSHNVKLREERLAEQLRVNLARRKAQSRERKAEKSENPEQLSGAGAKDG